MIIRLTAAEKALLNRPDVNALVKSLQDSYDFINTSPYNLRLISTVVVLWILKNLSYLDNNRECLGSLIASFLLPFDVGYYFTMQIKNIQAIARWLSHNDTRIILTAGLIK